LPTEVKPILHLFERLNRALRRGQENLLHVGIHVPPYSVQRAQGERMGAKLDQSSIGESFKSVEDGEEQDPSRVTVSMRALDRPSSAKELVEAKHGVLMVSRDVVSVGIREKRRIRNNAQCFVQTSHPPRHSGCGRGGGQVRRRRGRQRRARRQQLKWLNCFAGGA
jgi:hypothetical protein